MVCSHFLFLRDSILVGSMFLGLSFLSWAIQFVGIILIVVSFDLLYFYGIGFNVSSFISDIVYLHILTFFSVPKLLSI